MGAEKTALAPHMGRRLEVGVERSANQLRGGLNGVSDGGPPGDRPSIHGYQRALGAELHHFGTAWGSRSPPDVSSTAEVSSDESSGASKSPGEDAGDSVDAASESGDVVSERQLPA